MKRAICPRCLLAHPATESGEQGQTLVEYALIIAFVAIALVLALQTLAGSVDSFFGDVIAVLQDAIS